MKKFIFPVILLCLAKGSFSQTFMHGVGLTVLGGTATKGNNNEITYAEGFTYSPRVNFIETESLSVSAGINLTLGISASSSTNNSSGAGASVGFVVNAPLMINLNMGRGSTKENEKKFGYFVGGGLGFHHGDFIASYIDEYGYENIGGKSINTFGVAANAGVRFGVGRTHKNIEVRLSYMKGFKDTKPNIFGIAGLFNF